MERDIKFLEEANLDINVGIGYTGSKEKYLLAVHRYYENYEKNKAKIENYCNSKDYENYMITVHALKSNSKMIGALELSREFEALELAAKDKDEEIIQGSTGFTLALYGALIEKISPIDEWGITFAADELTAPEAKETARKLLNALDDFDDELAGKLARKLSGYPFRITQKGMLTQAIQLIDDFMYEEAIKLIKQITSTIE